MTDDSLLFKEALKQHLKDLECDPQYEVVFQRHIEVDHFNIFLDYIEKYKKLQNLLVLDLGCGSGGCTYQLLRRGAKVISIDIDKSLLNISKIRNIKSSRVDFILADGTKLPFRRNAFDVCICLHVIEHVNSPLCLIKELNRVLKCGGILLLEYPNRFYIREQHSDLLLMSYLPKKIADFIARNISKLGFLGKDYTKRFNIILLYPHNLSYFSVKRRLNFFPLKILDENPIDRFILDYSTIKYYGPVFKFIFEKINTRILKIIAKVFSKSTTFILKKEALYNQKKYYE